MTNQIRTLFASRAITIAESFNGVVGQTPVEGPIVYRVEMVVPDGPSTGGGKHSVQHLRLVPVEGGSAVVIGQCDQIEMTAVLRSWELLAEQYSQRFKGTKLPIDAVEYGKLLERMDAFFRENTMRVDRQDIDRAPVMSPKEPRRVYRSNPTVVRAAPSLPWAIALILAGAVLGSAITLMFR